MRIGRLRIEQLRVVEAAEIEPGPGLLLFTGPNGAGKTSVLEALHLLAYCRYLPRCTPRAVAARDGSV
jgi:DNA replication and repair protein RecF